MDLVLVVHVVQLERTLAVHDEKVHPPGVMTTHPYRPLRIITVDVARLE